MAKSFKQQAGVSESAPGTLASVGPDFFDLLTGAERLTEEPAPELVSPVSSVLAPEAISAAKPASAPRKVRTVGNTPLPSLPALPKAEPHEAISAEAEEDARQTFVMDKRSLEQLRDYVHARRSSGDYRYSQKQALREAITEFLAARQLAPPRPQEAREYEQQFRDRIRKGREATKTPTV
jgi:hypothetical protein